MEQQALSFENVTFSYSEGEHGRFAVKNVSFSVREGEYLAILGQNGSGKSTLAKLTNKLLDPDEGKITVFGMDVSDAKNTFEVRKNVGIVFQNPDNQMVASIVEDDVAFGPENIGVPREEIGRRISSALSAVDMEEFRYGTPTRLSGGQKQRIAIAGVLAIQPKILILDESTAMLDPRGRKEVMSVVERLNKENHLTVIFITHFMDEALRADRALVMSHGEIVMDGKPQEIFSREEDLEKYHLTLPAAASVSLALKKGGMNVETAFTAEELAKEVVKCVSKRKI